MRRAALASLLCAVLLIPGCDAVFIGGVFNPNTQTVSGTVSNVFLTFVSDGHGNSIQATIVTLVVNLGQSTIAFCGNQQSQFPMNQFAQATFVPGQPCSNLLTVVIIIN